MAHSNIVSFFKQKEKQWHKRGMNMIAEHKKRLKCEIYNDSMQNWKSKPIQKAQLIIADVPYNVGTNFYGSNPVWYKGGGQQER